MRLGIGVGNICLCLFLSLTILSGCIYYDSSNRSNGENHTCFIETERGIEPHECEKESIDSMRSMPMLSIINRSNQTSSLMLFANYEALAKEVDQQDRQLLAYQLRRRHFYLKLSRQQKHYQDQRRQIIPYQSFSNRDQFRQRRQEAKTDWAENYPQMERYNYLMQIVDNGLYPVKNNQHYYLPADRSLLLIALDHNPTVAPQLLRIELKEGAHYELYIRDKQIRPIGLKRAPTLQYRLMELYEVRRDWKNGRLVASTALDDNQSDNSIINPYGYQLILDYLQIEQNYR